MKKESLTILLALLMSMVASVASAQKIEIDGIYYYFTKEEAEVTSNPNNYSGDITIPASVEYDERTYIVNRIRESAFNECTGLTSVTIPSSVESIGKSAFADCTGLSSIIIPNSVTYIGSEAFLYCLFAREKFINHSGLTDEDNWGAFLCDEETQDGLLIDNHVAVKCRPWATSVNIPNSVTDIDGFVFAYCTGLASVTIGNSVKSIGDDAFEGCTGLASVTIGSSVKSIGNWAFCECENLSSITIPSSVTSIGEGAFWGCNNLASITCYATNPPALDDSPFYGIPNNATLYVPAGIPAGSTKAAYVASGWSSYFDANHIEEMGYVEITSAGMATFSSDKALDFTGVDGLKAYIIPEGPEGEGDVRTLTFTRVNVVPANTGLLLKGNAGTYSVPVATTDQYDDVLGNKLRPGSASVPSTEEDVNGTKYLNYVLTKDKLNEDDPDTEKVVAFFRFEGTRNDLSGKAYLQLPASANGGVNGFKFVFSDEEANAIADVPSYGTGTGEAIYNLAGQRVQKPAKGIYIMGGKKVFMK